MSISDALQRFTFDGSDVRGELLGLEASIHKALERQPYPQLVKVKLAELMAGASLLSSMVKLKGRLSLQVQSDGPMKMLMAEVTNNTDLRAYVSKDPGTSWENVQAERWPHDARLVITLEPDQGQRYQGIVSMHQGSLEQAIETYFQQSEQLPTRIWMARSETKLSALVLQQLPKSEQHDPDAWDRLVILADTLREDELLHLSNERILHRLFHEESVRLYDPLSLRFHCSCSKPRIGLALIQLGKSELDEIIQEQGKVSIDCQFCGQHYAFDQGDIDTLFTSH